MAGRKKKYNSDELKLMRRIWNRDGKRRRRQEAREARIRASNQFYRFDEEIVRAPAEVLAERDYRYSLGFPEYGPPRGYCPRYADTAISIQLKLATMRA